MKLKVLSIVLIGIMAVLVSCMNKDDSDLMEMEQRIFDSYIQKYNIDIEPTESGLYIIPERVGTGTAPLLNDWVLIKYNLYKVDEEELIITTDKRTAIDHDIFDDRVVYGISKVQVGNNIKGLDEALTSMKEGGKAKLVFMSDLGYGKEGSGKISSYSSLFIEVELLEVIKDPISYEEQKMTDYLNADTCTFLDTLESGLIFMETQTGNGISPGMYSFVTVDVLGYFLDGRVFLDEDVFRFQLGKYDYAVTKGFSEGVSLMEETGKAKLIVPYYLAYGEIGKSYYEGKAKVPIPPYTTLIYEVEMIEAQ